MATPEGPEDTFFPELDASVKPAKKKKRAVPAAAAEKKSYIHFSTVTTENNYDSQLIPSDTFTEKELDFFDTFTTLNSEDMAQDEDPDFTLKWKETFESLHRKFVLYNNAADFEDNRIPDSRWAHGRRHGRVMASDLRGKTIRAVFLYVIIL